MAHAVYLEWSHDPNRRCKESWLTGAELRSIGDFLTVDRIDPAKGYVTGNMQTISRRLNRMKWRSLQVPLEEVGLLLIRYYENRGPLRFSP